MLGIHIQAIKVSDFKEPSICKWNSLDAGRRTAELHKWFQMPREIFVSMESLLAFYEWGRGLAENFNFNMNDNIEKHTARTQL